MSGSIAVAQQAPKQASQFTDDIVAPPGRNSIRMKSRQLWRSIEILFLVGAGTARIPL